MLLSMIDDINWELTKEFTYKLHCTQEEYIIIPKGFVTRFSLIPIFFWRTMNPCCSISHLLLIHDYLYQRGKIYVGNSNNYKIVTKQEADMILEKELIRSNISKTQRIIVLFLIKSIGYLHWRKINIHNK